MNATSLPNLFGFFQLKILSHVAVVRNNRNRSCGIQHSPEYEIVWKISLAHLSTVKLTEEFSGGNHQITTSVAFYSSSVLMPLDLALQRVLPPQCPIPVNVYLPKHSICIY